MRKIILIFFSFLLFFSIFPSRASAQLPSEEKATESSQTVGYDLPYPGIHPDNPLHFLKAIRDRIVGVLISDPLKKAEFNLLTSDKRISSAMMLAAKGKDKLGIETLSKSNNYFHQAISSANEARNMGKRIDMVLHNLELSSKKHKELVRGMEEKVSREFLSQLQSEEKRLSEFEKSVIQLRTK